LSPFLSKPAPPLSSQARRIYPEPSPFLGPNPDTNPNPNHDCYFHSKVSHHSFFSLSHCRNEDRSTHIPNSRDRHKVSVGWAGFFLRSDPGGGYPPVILGPGEGRKKFGSYFWVKIFWTPIFWGSPGTPPPGPPTSPIRREYSVVTQAARS